MQKKNKVMLAAAIGMVAIVVASTAVRCSMAGAAGGGETLEAEESQAQEQVLQADDAEDVDAAQSRSEGVDDALAILQGHVWQAEDDPAKTIAFRAGSFVESDGERAALTAFEAKAVSDSDGQKVLRVEVMHEGDPYVADGAIAIEGSEGALSLTSGAFSMAARYVQAQTSAAPVTVTGLAEPYTSLIDGRQAELASALSSWCRSHAPSASSASFDGEVYLDVKGGRVSATFHLDDAASTIVSAVYADGAFDIQG